jgi:hypothetical protein
MSEQAANGNGTDQGKTINLSFALTRTDLFWYNIHFVRLLVAGSIIFFILAIAVFVCTLYVPPGDLKTTLIWLVMAFGVGFSLCAGSIAAVVLQIFILKNETVAKAMTSRNYTISESGVAVYNEKGRIKRTWEEIRKVVKTHHGFYIKTGDKIAIVLPRHAFGSRDQIELFEQLAGLAKV